MSEQTTSTPQLIGISRLHAVRVTEARHDGESAYVGQPLAHLGDKIIGGTLCPVYSDKASDANALAEAIAEAWNEHAKRLRGGA